MENASRAWVKYQYEFWGNYPFNTNICSADQAWKPNNKPSQPKTNLVNPGNITVSMYFYYYVIGTMYIVMLDVYYAGASLPFS